MRSVDIAMAAASLPLLVCLLIRGSAPGWLRWTLLIALAIMIGQIASEGVRWTLLPVYAVVVAALVASNLFQMPACMSRWLAACGIVLLAASLAMCWVLPVFSLPRPGGPNQIGTTIVPLTDPSRIENQSNVPGQYREIQAQVWYPADVAGRRMPYRNRDEVTIVKQHLAMVKTDASIDVPIAESPSRFPVIVFSPSWIGRRTQNTVQAQELASHGFIVIGLDHPYGTDITVFPDGRRVSSTIGELLDFATDESLSASLHHAERELETRVADVRFVIDQIENPAPETPFREIAIRVDAARIGVFGHSFGGAVATEACVEDSRIKAGANLDGLIFGRAISAKLTKPFLFIGDSTPVPTAEQLAAMKGSQLRNWTFIRDNEAQIRAALPRESGFFLTIRGASHMNLCDSALYSPIRKLTNAGVIRPERAMQIVNAYLVAFFDSTLRGQRSNLLDSLKSPFPEVNFDR